jgi:hypothetical protein
MTNPMDEPRDERARDERARVADNDEIAARAAALPPLHASRDLWPGIEARIAGAARRHTRPMLSRWLANPVAIAAAVVVAAGATVIVATRSSPRSRSLASAPATGTTPPNITPVRLDKQPANITYEREIATLRTIVRQRQPALDPKTRAVIAKNLAVIDQAVAESRAALAKDPNSSFLLDQLDHTLDTEVDLLRTAALLPTHT